MSTAADTANHASSRHPSVSHATTAGINAIRRNTCRRAAAGSPSNPSIAASNSRQTLLRAVTTTKHHGGAREHHLPGT